MSDSNQTTHMLGFEFDLHAVSGGRSTAGVVRAMSYAMAPMSLEKQLRDAREALAKEQAKGRMANTRRLELLKLEIEEYEQQIRAKNASWQHE